MKKSLKKDEISVGFSSNSGRFRKALLGLAIVGAVTVVSCADDKNCTDSNSADPLGDSGATADPSDLSVVNDYGDSAGNGDECRDYD